jgi:NADPH-dependent glutamate synthase beta subunit-like oxidoreductase
MAIAQGKTKEALAIIRESLPLPAVCGRVCHHPCEAACNRAKVDKPIAIQWLKRLVADLEIQNGAVVPEPYPRTKKERVAIVGSGPAGLTAAYDLVKEGYAATVFEALPVAGGMLATGVPEFVLPRNVLKAEIDYLVASGVEIRLKRRLGKDFTLDELRKVGYRAVLLATGAHRSATLSIPGSDLRGVYHGLPFLTQVALGDRPDLGRRVVVIGGGNAAIDVARAAVRLGAAEVHLACLESRSQMPAFLWEIEKAEREGVKIHASLAPQEIEGLRGRAASVNFKRVRKFTTEGNGRISWTLMEGPGSDYTIPADAVIIAIGQAPDASFADGQITIGPRGAIVVDPDSMATNVPGVFAVGDAVRVVGTVTESIAAGHQAAGAIMTYFGEQPAWKRPAAKEVFRIEEKEIPPYLQRKPRWQMPSLATEDAARSFAEVQVGYPLAVGIEEARRCLNCRMCGNCIFGRGQICFEQSTRLLR